MADARVLGVGSGDGPAQACPADRHKAEEATIPFLSLRAVEHDGVLTAQMKPPKSRPDNIRRMNHADLPNGIVLTYTYDNDSRVTAMTWTLSGNSVGDLEYSYDAHSRVIQKSDSFAITKLPPPVTGNTFNAANEMTAFNGVPFSYDANGNLTSDGTNTYPWDARNHLAEILGSSTASLVYDAFGRRAQKTVNGASTQFLYDRWNPVQEVHAGTPSANLLTGLRIDEYFQRTDSAGARDYLTDILGSTLALTDASGTEQTRYLYDPFGNTALTGTSSSNPYQFTGRENDGTGLDYYRARYYSPAFQRFIAQDPIGIAGGMNLYAYTLDDPTNLIDAFGLDVSICDRPLKPFPGEWWKFKHQYNCVEEGNFVICFGLGPAPGYFLTGPGQWELDQPNKSCKKQSKNPCVDSCLLDFLLDSPPNYDAGNLDGGINCQKFAKSVIGYCQAQCAMMSGGGVAF